MEVFDELQVTRFVRSCVVPSEKPPVAVNCCWMPFGTLAGVGVTTISCSTALVTVKTVLPLTPPEVAVMVVVPAAIKVAKPWLGDVLLMVAAAVFEELQVTEVVIS
jgi:hypothetical protein